MIVLVCVFTLHINFRWISNQLVEGSDGKPHRFQHPVVLTLLMFLGEFLCFAVYKVIHVLLSRRGVSNKRLLIRLNLQNYIYIYVHLFVALQRRAGTYSDTRHQPTASAEHAVALFAAYHCFNIAVHRLVFDLCH